jgi:acyl-homoserine lactone acylase PvdQ
MTAGAHGSQPAFVFSKRSSYRNRELQSMRAMAGLSTANGVADADRAAAMGTMSFNVFFADDQGHVGYRYAGLMPLRSPDLDPRFPSPSDPKYNWTGIVPPSQMPHIIDPKGGLLTNWNNKPVSWWPNLDTPVWGRIFRVEAIRRNLTSETLSAQDLELAAWKIARTDETWPYFAPYVQQAAKEIKGAALQIGGYDGLLLQGSRQAMTYRTFISELRKDLFGATVGTFMGEQYATQIAQPSAMLAALQGRTKFNYLQGRKAEAVVKKALQAAVDKEATSEDRYLAGQIRIPDEPSIPYSNRGTYIQVIELLTTGPSGRNVLPPGEAASGTHSRDQVPLSRAWVFKPMHRPWKQ